MHRLDTRQHLCVSMHSLTTSTPNFREMAQTSPQTSSKIQIFLFFSIVEFFVKLVICIIYKTKYDNDMKLGPEAYLEHCQTSKPEIFVKIVNYFCKSSFLDLLLSSEYASRNYWHL